MSYIITQQVIKHKIFCIITPKYSMGKEQQRTNNIEELLRQVEKLPLRRISKEVIFIRHGWTEWNTQGRLQGSKNTELLSEQGGALLKQVEQLQAILGLDMFKDTRHIIVSSGMLRATQTAGIIKREFGMQDNIVQMPDFNEMSFGDWEGELNSELQKRPEHNLFINNPLEASMQGIPSGSEGMVNFLCRVANGVRALSELLQDTQDRHIIVILVAHSGTARAIRFFHKIQRSSGVKSPNFIVNLGQVFFSERDNYVDTVPRSPLIFEYPTGEFQQPLDM